MDVARLAARLAARRERENLEQLPVKNINSRFLRHSNQIPRLKGCLLPDFVVYPAEKLLQVIECNIAHMSDSEGLFL